MVNPNEFTSFMPKDNVRKAQENVMIDETLFDPAVCVFDQSGIYWSVKITSDDLIELHGCGGDTYPYPRPRSETDKVEWFR